MMFVLSRAGLGLVAVASAVLVTLFLQEYFADNTPGCCEADDRFGILVLTTLYLLLGLGCFLIAYQDRKRNRFATFDWAMISVVLVAAFVILCVIVVANLVPVLAAPSTIAILCIAIRLLKTGNKSTEVG